MVRPPPPVAVRQAPMPPTIGLTTPPNSQKPMAPSVDVRTVAEFDKMSLRQNPKQLNVRISLNFCNIKRM